MKITGPVRALGTMSGTSLDGVDAALLITDGISISGFGDTAYRAYTPEERAVLRDALGAFAGTAEAEAAAEVVETAHAALLAPMTEGADLIGFHGQTLLHRPERKLTHQAGNGDMLAEALGLPVVWDFRSSDVGLGGQGAPLAPFYHWALARHIGARTPLAILNIGGVANITWVDPTAPSPETEGALLAFDTGPGNAPIDDLVNARLGARFDRDGALAARGRPDPDTVDAILGHPYFARVPPKSLDRGDFDDLSKSVSALTDADAAATLTFATAAAAILGFEHCPAPPARLLVTGGGRRNPTLMADLARLSDCPVAPVEDVGLDGDMIEAQAFAYLAVRVARGLPTSAPGTTGIGAPVGGGRISEP